MDVRLQKVSRVGGEGLKDCTYALWMVGDTNSVDNSKRPDVLVAEAETDANGWMTFKNVHLQQGARYYFKEVTPPTGHKVDPYRSAYLTLDSTGTQLVLAENTTDGLHAS